MGYILLPNEPSFVISGLYHLLVMFVGMVSKIYENALRDAFWGCKKGGKQLKIFLFYFTLSLRSNLLGLGPINKVDY